MKPKRYIVWSADEVDLDDPWQRKWYIRQVLTRGRMEDVRTLDPAEVDSLLDALDLPNEIDALWRDLLRGEGGPQARPDGGPLEVEPGPAPQQAVREEEAMVSGKGIIDERQREALRVMRDTPDQEQFYLTGGTALAEFYLGHRRSLDLDFFTAEPSLIVPFSRALEERFRSEGWTVGVPRRFAAYVEFELSPAGSSDSVRVDLARDSPFRFDPPAPTEFGVSVSGYRDLAADKVLAFYGRAEPRDAVDLYFLLRRESIERLMELAGKKDPGFDAYWFAAALEKTGDFPDELEQWPVEMLAEFDPVALKKLFRGLAGEIMKEGRGGK